MIRSPLRAAALACALAGCQQDLATLEIAVRASALDSPFAQADSVTLSISDAADRTLSLRRVLSSASAVALDAVPFGADYQVQLSASLGSDLVSFGRSCRFVVAQDVPPPRVPLYFTSIGRFFETAAPGIARAETTLVPSSDGILLVGGVQDGAPTALTERYRHDTGDFEPIADLSAARVGAAAVQLADGSALVLGGAARADAPFAELYSSGTFQALSTEGPATLRRASTTLLSDGRILVTGGVADTAIGARQDAFVLVSRGSVLSPVQSLLHARAGHSAVRLGADRFSPVLIVGGQAGELVFGDLELFDPDQNTMTSLATSLAHPRVDHSATLLSNGRVLIVGGADGAHASIASAELFDPVIRMIRDVPSLSQARSGHTATLLASGRVLVAGGVDSQGRALASVEVYDPQLGTNGAFLPTVPMVHARAGHHAVPLCDGSVLFAGGTDDGRAEIYTPPP